MKLQGVPSLSGGKYWHRVETSQEFDEGILFSGFLPKQATKAWYVQKNEIDHVVFCSDTPVVTAEVQNVEAQFTSKSVVFERRS